MKRKPTIPEQLKSAPAPAKQMKGFAVMPAKLQRKIATQGGHAVHAIHGSEHMAKIGAKGGKG